MPVGYRPALSAAQLVFVKEYICVGFLNLFPVDERSDQVLLASHLTGGYGGPACPRRAPRQVPVHQLLLLFLVEADGAYFVHYPEGGEVSAFRG